MLFGPNVAQRFLERSSLSLIVRSHEQVLEGFDWPYGDRHHLVTVFSASNYANRTRNKGAFMVIGARGGVGARERHARINNEGTKRPGLEHGPINERKDAFGGETVG